LRFAAKLEERNDHEIKKKKAQAKFNQSKQPASLHKNPQIHKKTIPNSQEKRKVGNTEIGNTALSNNRRSSGAEKKSRNRQTHIF